VTAAPGAGPTKVDGRPLARIGGGDLPTVAVDPKNGFMRDATLDLDGFKNVLKLRAELHGDWGGKPPAPEQYIDLSHYQRAIAGM